MSDFSNPTFHDESKARVWLEKELWPDGPICPHCGVINQATLLHGKSHRPGLYQCNACREPFTVTVGTLYERSKIPLHKWLAATHLMMASKKGMSSLQIGRMLGLSKKTAWFLCHRIRESLRDTNPEMLGGEGKMVEIDESFVGGLEKNKHRNKRKHAGTGGAGKEAVFALVERGGKVRSHHIPAVNASNLRPIVEAQIHGATYVMTDEGAPAKKVGSEFALHGSVNHSIGEYVRGDIHTNTIEGYFSIMKRGIYGTFHHVSQQHLKRYLAEFDFRYNERSALGIEDAERMSKSIQGIVGKAINLPGLLLERMRYAMARLNLLETGIFTVAEASRLIRASEQKVRGWIAGYPRRGEPILQNELGWLEGKLAFSFTNLMEMRFLVFFAAEGIHLNSLRFMAQEARQILRHPHPFATNTLFKTDGKRIYADIIERSGDNKLYNLHARNFEMAPIIERTLKKEIVYDPSGFAHYWRPRPELAPNVIVHPKHAFGQPMLKESGVPVRALIDALKSGETVRAVSRWFEVPEQQVREAEKFDRDLALAT